MNGRDADRDGLERRWKERERRFEASERHARMAERALASVCAPMSLGARLGLALELALDAVALGYLGAFAARHVAEPRYFVPAVSLHLMLVVLTGQTVQRLALARASSLSRSASWTFLALRRASLRNTRWRLALLPLAWTPAVIVLLRSLGVDAYAGLGVKWLAANLLLGALSVPFLLRLARSSTRVAAV